MREGDSVATGTSKVLLTGGCGFIGSHQAVVLLEAGHDVVIVDDLSNARASTVDRIAEIAGRRPHFVELDVRETAALTDVLVDQGCDSVIHFAGLKHVRESMERPFDYFEVNLNGLTSLLQASRRAGVRKVIFSSSGSIYGDTDIVPIGEDTAPSPAIRTPTPSGSASRSCPGSVPSRTTGRSSPSATSTRLAPTRPAGSGRIRPT